MFRRVHGTFDSQDLLRARNLVGINKTVAMMPESRANLRSGRERHHHAACAAVQIQDERGPGSVDEFHIDGDFIHIGAAFEYARKARLDDDLNPQIRPVSLEQRQRRCGQHAIAQRAQANHSDPRARGEAVEQ
jgi:hypothetical protein